MNLVLALSFALPAVTTSPAPATLRYESSIRWPTAESTSLSPIAIGDRLFVGIDAANLRVSADRNAAVLATLEIARPLEVLAVGPPVSVDGRVERWVQVSVGAPSSSPPPSSPPVPPLVGYLFGSVVTPLAGTADLNGDGSVEAWALSWGGDFVARLRVDDPKLAADRRITRLELGTPGDRGGTLTLLEVPHALGPHKRELIGVQACDATPECRVFVVAYDVDADAGLGLLGALIDGPAVSGPAVVVAAASDVYAATEVSVAGHRTLLGAWPAVVCPGCPVTPAPRLRPHYKGLEKVANQEGGDRGPVRYRDCAEVAKMMAGPYNGAPLVVCAGSFDQANYYLETYLNLGKSTVALTGDVIESEGERQQREASARVFGAPRPEPVIEASEPQPAELGHAVPIVIGSTRLQPLGLEVDVGKGAPGIAPSGGYTLSPYSGGNIFFGQPYEFKNGMNEKASSLLVHRDQGTIFISKDARRLISPQWVGVLVYDLELVGAGFVLGVHGPGGPPKEQGLIPRLGTADGKEKCQATYVQLLASPPQLLPDVFGHLHEVVTKDRWEGFGGCVERQRRP